MYRGNRCGGVVYPMGTSHHMFFAGEEHMGVVRNAKRMRPSSVSSARVIKMACLCDGARVSVRSLCIL